MANLGLTCFINDWMNVSARIRKDHSGNDYTEKLYASTNTLMTVGSPNGLYGITRTVDDQMYGDLLLNIDKELTDELSFQFNGGVSFSDIRSDAFVNKGPICLRAGDSEGINEPVGIPNVFNVFQLSDSQTLREQNGWRKKPTALRSVELGFRNAYYLTLTGGTTGPHNWRAQLGEQVVFYPSVGGSVLLSGDTLPAKEISLYEGAGFLGVGWTSFSSFSGKPHLLVGCRNKVWITKTHYPLYT